MTEENQGIDIEQVVAAYNQMAAELDKAKKMIDKMCYSVFGYIDSWFDWVDKQFIRSKNKRKKK